MYIDFTTYTSLGGTVTDQATFNRLEFQSRMDVDFVTADRLKKLNDQELDFESLKMLMVELIEDCNIAHVADTMSNKYGGQVTSVSNDGYSVGISSKTGSKTSTKGNAETQSQRYNMIQRYLPQYSYRGLGIGMVERGLYPYPI